jgi:hypothetical protein
MASAWARLLTAALMLLALLALPFFGAGPLTLAAALVLISASYAAAVSAAEAPAKGSIGNIERARRPFLFWFFVVFSAVMSPVMLLAGIWLARILVVSGA